MFMVFLRVDNYEEKERIRKRETWHKLKENDETSENENC